MNLETDCTPIFDQPTVAAYKLHRRRRVRHSYPESLVQLVGHLRTRMHAREISTALGIPLSSVYRWAPIPQLASEMTAGGGTLDAWEPLLSRCRAEGFDVPRTLFAGLSPAARFDNRDTESPSALRKPAKAIPHLELARSMIEREYFRDIDSEALAAAAGLSRFRFIHAFTAAYRISLHQYLLRIRIAAAKRLLATSRETIDVIAAATGFRSGACLNRAYTRVEGHCISRFCRVVGSRP